MHSGVACRAKRNQVLLRIIAGLAAKLFVVNLKVGHRAATLGISSQRDIAPGNPDCRTARDRAAGEAASVGPESRHFLAGPKATSAVRDEVGFWNCSVQSRKNASVFTGELHQMAVRRLLWGLNPGRKMRNIVIIQDKCKW